jgi:hypothetical protein
MNTRCRWLPNVAALALLVSLPAGAQTVQVVAQGLDNPRGLGFAPNGELYVAEAGSGGTGACRPSPDGQPVDVCYGETGALTRIDPQGLLPPVRVFQNLPSMAAAGGFAASSGPVDVDFFGMAAYVVMGWGGDPALRNGIGAKSELFGTILRALPNGQYRAVVDVSGNESRHNPAGGRIDSNPYGIAALPGRRVVADAGANALIAFSASDGLDNVADHTLAVLPPTAFGTEPVPTTVVAGPDGYLYVGQLTGAPFFRGSSTIWRISPQGGAAEPYVTGLTAVVDIAFDHAGTLYVIEIASGFVPPPAGDGNPGVGNGRLLRIRQGGAPEVLLSGLVFPAGVAVGPDNALYVTNFGIFPDGGQVLRITE